MGVSAFSISILYTFAFTVIFTSHSWYKLLAWYMAQLSAPHSIYRFPLDRSWEACVFTSLLHRSEPVQHQEYNFCKIIFSRKPLISNQCHCCTTIASSIHIFSLTTNKDTSTIVLEHEISISALSSVLFRSFFWTFLIFKSFRELQFHWHQKSCNTSWIAKISK